MAERIPVTGDVVVDCAKCNPSACCMGNLVIQLSQDEAIRMTDTGNTLITVELPRPYFRKNVPYPIGYENDELGLTVALVEDGREHEPLEAGYGRFIMRDACTNLKTDMLGRTSCAIYEDRPKACADFVSGSDSCHKMQNRLKDVIS
jgi:Fe-S-cluster containining protein